MHYNCQVFLRAADTLQSKYAFERVVDLAGVKIQGYRSDNYNFNSAEFLKDIGTQDQTINLCGIRAHHQNGLAERAIQTVVYWSWTMVINFSIHWPEYSQLELWPMDMERTNFV